MRKRILCLTALAVIGSSVLASCGGTSIDPTTNPTTTPTEEPTTVPTTEEIKTGTVSIATATNGLVVADKSSGNVGDIITLSATPEQGYSVGEIKANNVVLTEGAGKTYKFTLIEGENKVTATFVKDAIKLTLDKETLLIDEIGHTAEVKASVVGITSEKVQWTIDDPTIASIVVSEDGSKCTVTNLKGGMTVLTAKIEGEEKMVTVKGSVFQDARSTYSVYDEAGVSIGDYKGFYNALDKLQVPDIPATETTQLITLNKGFITKKDSADVIYVRDDAKPFNAVTKNEGTYKGIENEKVVDGKFAWFSEYETVLRVDDQKDYSIFQGAGGAKGQFISRASNFDKSLFLDGNKGYSTAGDPGANVWSGWRASLYKGTVTQAQLVTWADPYKWNEMEISFDLSESKLIPSLNNEQGAFAQIYLGSTYRLKTLVGIVIDAGTLDECAALEDGAKRDIKVFTETLNLASGMAVQAFNADRTIHEEVVGSAIWDSFNKAWTFPEVNLTLDALIEFTGENATDTTANYKRNYTITGYKGKDKVASFKHLADYGEALVRDGSNERSTYGVSLTPKYEGKNVADITCGAQWLNVRQIASTAYNLPGSETASQSIMFGAGRTVNGANQSGLYGSDCLTMTNNKDGESIFNFIY